MAKSNKKDNVYKITCYSSHHVPHERVIWNRAYSLRENWEIEKLILDFWRLDGYRIKSVELSKI